ncbi:MAG: hypothetical protein E6I26_12175 [Chloroflexi bacterium]|nr:MAG: hypothetical protein E6I26_12175 [Chloroflexota bacterium]
MPPLEAFGPSIAIGLILFVMLWFALGTQRNIRIGNDLLRWLQRGLPLLGRRTTLRWLGSSAVELRIVEPAEPFREATVLAVLEPRDVSLLWAFARWRGRRDFLIVRASLVRPPRFSMEVRDPRTWTGRADGHDQATNGGGETGWHRLDWPGGCVAVAGPGADEAAIRSTWEALGAASGGVWKLTVQPVVPHLEVHVRPAGDRPVGADALLTPIRQLAATLTQR